MSVCCWLCLQWSNSHYLSTTLTSLRPHFLIDSTVVQQLYKAMSDSISSALSISKCHHKSLTVEAERKSKIMYKRQKQMIKSSVGMQAGYCMTRNCYKTEQTQKVWLTLCTSTLLRQPQTVATCSNAQTNVRQTCISHTHTFWVVVVAERCQLPEIFERTEHHLSSLSSPHVPAPSLRPTGAASVYSLPSKP